MRPLGSFWFHHQTSELLVDFNDLDEHRNVLVYLGRRNAGKTVVVDDEVILRDREGASVRGVVLGRNRDGDVVVEAAWSTWADPDSLRVRASALLRGRLSGSSMPLRV